MSANLEQAILKKLQALPDTRQQEVLALVESLLEKEQAAPAESTRRPIGEIFEELSSQIPFEEWAELPRDGAEQHDHYLYGSPKRNNP
jgi:Tfp pilus assembly protein PilN